MSTKHLLGLGLALVRGGTADHSPPDVAKPTSAYFPVTEIDKVRHPEYYRGGVGDEPTIDFGTWCFHTFFDSITDDFSPVFVDRSNLPYVCRTAALLDKRGVLSILAIRTSNETPPRNLSFSQAVAEAYLVDVYRCEEKSKATAVLLEPKNLIVLRRLLREWADLDSTTESAIASLALSRITPNASDRVAIYRKAIATRAGTYPCFRATLLARLCVDLVREGNPKEARMVANMAESDRTLLVGRIDCHVFHDIQEWGYLREPFPDVWDGDIEGCGQSFHS
jgi:hypothetical protein